MAYKPCSRRQLRPNLGVKREPGRRKQLLQDLLALVNSLLNPIDAHSLHRKSESCVCALSGTSSLEQIDSAFCLKFRRPEGAANKRHPIAEVEPLPRLRLLLLFEQNGSCEQGVRNAQVRKRELHLTFSCGDYVR